VHHHRREDERAEVGVPLEAVLDPVVALGLACDVGLRERLAVILRCEEQVAVGMHSIAWHRSSIP
jgi:hypothetical protein